MAYIPAKILFQRKSYDFCNKLSPSPSIPSLRSGLRPAVLYSVSFLLFLFPFPPDADVLILDEKLKVRCVWQMGKIIENTLF